MMESFTAGQLALLGGGGPPLLAPNMVWPPSASLRAVSAPTARGVGAGQWLVHS